VNSPRYDIPVDSRQACALQDILYSPLCSDLGVPLTLNAYLYIRDNVIGGGDGPSSNSTN